MGLEGVIRDGVIRPSVGDVIPAARDVLSAASGLPEKISRYARDDKRDGR
jgi:hypothetical protein